MPLSSSTSPIYTNLINLLHPALPHPQILELDILPSSYPSTLYSSPPSLAVPKPLLANLFVTARAELFSYITSQKGVYAAARDDGEAQGSGNGALPTDEIPDGCADSNDSCYEAALSATRVLLLWDPNHVTAANFRKKHLLSRSRYLSFRPSSSHSTTSALTPAEAFLSLLRSELSFLTSLVTSPLPKAPKASTLWAHRLWLLRSFHVDVLVIFQRGRFEGGGREADSPSIRVQKGADSKPEDTAASAKKKKILQIEEKTPSSETSTLQELYTAELRIVMLAADRHPRNYYAWNYARALLTLLIDCNPKTRTSISTLTLTLALSVLPLIHAWCMTHPRDISGWTFLFFLIQKFLIPTEFLPSKTEPEAAGATTMVKEDADADDMRRAAKREVDRILRATEEAKERFGWRGESVSWFLGVMRGVTTKEGKKGGRGGGMGGRGGVRWEMMGWDGEGKE